MSDDLVRFISDPANAQLVRALIAQHQQTQMPFAGVDRGQAGGGDPVTQKFAEQRNAAEGRGDAFRSALMVGAGMAPFVPQIGLPIAGGGLGGMVSARQHQAANAGVRDMWMREDGRSSQYDPSMQMQPPMARAAPGEPPINAIAPYLPY